jgi:predicted enzyme related to lactoylglutathione lyase
MANPFVHIELNSTDPEKSKAFYTQLFDWKLDEMKGAGGMQYTTIDPGGGGTGGGIMKQLMPDTPSFWMAYALVDDAKASTAKAKSLGAKVMKDVTEVPGMGWFSIITDPTGAVLGLWQSASK